MTFKGPLKSKPSYDYLKSLCGSNSPCVYPHAVWSLKAAKHDDRLLKEVCKRNPIRCRAGRCWILAIPTMHDDKICKAQSRNQLFKDFSKWSLHDHALVWRLWCSVTSRINLSFYFFKRKEGNKYTCHVLVPMQPYLCLQKSEKWEESLEKGPTVPAGQKGFTQRYKQNSFSPLWVQTVFFSTYSYKD